jgi:uncharacterized protein YndB with AHSA1/START domain
VETPLSSEALRALSALHRRRLREIWRSAGWPCQDLIEVELLAAGLLQRQRDGDGRESLRVTDAGIGVLAATLKRNRAARDAHEALVARVAREMQRAGLDALKDLNEEHFLAREGFRLAMRGPSGRTHIATGRYREIVPPARLVFSWDWEHHEDRTGETLVTVTFTPVDALSTEVRIVHEHRQVLREVGGGAATYAALGDVPAWADAVLGVVQEGVDLRTANRASALQQASRFRWDNYAADMAAIYREAARA